MIIGATRIKAASGHQALADHVWRGPDNDAVTTLQGSEADLVDMVAAARCGGRRYAIRHYQISPGEPMSDAEALELIGRLAAEFGFAPETAVVVRHQKPRRVVHSPMLGTQGHDTHWHALVPEMDPVTCQVLDCSWMYPRHERLARETEIRLLHKVIKGRWNTSVIAALERRGEDRLARLLTEAGIDDGAPAYAAFTSVQRRVLERRHTGPQGQKLDLPGLVRRLQGLWAAHAPDRAELDQALRRHGLRLRHPEDPLLLHGADGRPVAPSPSTRSTGWVVDSWDGKSRKPYVLGAAHRLLRERQQRVVEILRQRHRPGGLLTTAKPTTPAEPAHGDDQVHPAEPEGRAPQGGANSTSRGR